MYLALAGWSRPHANSFLSNLFLIRLAVQSPLMHSTVGQKKALSFFYSYLSMIKEKVSVQTVRAPMGMFFAQLMFLHVANRLSLMSTKNLKHVIGVGSVSKSSKYPSTVNIYLLSDIFFTITIVANPAAFSFLNLWRHCKRRDIYCSNFGYL